MPHVLAWIVHEILEMLPVAIFFGVGFIVIVVTTNLVLADYALRFGNFLLVVTAALIVGKAVLVANATPFLRRYDTMPLAWTILYKAGVYCLFVFAVRVIELIVEGWLGGTSFDRISGGVVVASLPGDPDLAIRAVPGLRHVQRDEPAARRG